MNALAAYLNAGGRLLVLLDPVLGQTEGSGLVATGLEAWLARYGVRAGRRHRARSPERHPRLRPRDAVLQRLRRPPGHQRPRPGAAAGAASHWSARSAPGRPPGSRSPSCCAPPTRAGARPTSASSTRCSRDAADLAGPVPLGRGDRGTEAGSARRGWSSSATPTSPPTSSCRRNAPNPILLANALNWLVERESLLAIPPQEDRAGAAEPDRRARSARSTCSPSPCCPRSPS